MARRLVNGAIVAGISTEVSQSSRGLSQLGCVLCDAGRVADDSLDSTLCRSCARARTFWAMRCDALQLSTLNFRTCLIP